jgi:hypothetical protein
MLDVVLALSVLGAVIFFGALLSIGNERQRRAIDGIREQAARWAEADLRLKRARAAREVRVDDPRAWLEGIVSRLLGVSPMFTSLYPWEQEEARAMVGVCSDGRRMVATSLPPDRFLKIMRSRPRSRLAQAEVGLLGDHPKRVPVYELSIVTAGAFFDLEAAQAWQEVTGTPLGAERLYLFEVPRSGRGR